MTATVRPRAMNLAGVVEQSESGSHPYEIDLDGRPYVPIGSGGVVLGVALGDPIDATDTDHVAPGVTLAHPDVAARHALTVLSCAGNRVTVRSGNAAGRTGFVVGKRGDAGHVIVHFTPDVLADLRPGDAMSVRALGQGAPGPVEGVTALNIDPGLWRALPIRVDGATVEVGVRAVVSSEVCGNGIGRPAHGWDVDLCLGYDPDVISSFRFGDLVAVDDLDARTNMGFRAGFRTVGVIVHGPSPRPGHGPGFMPILSGPMTLLTVRVDGAHAGVTSAALAAMASAERTDE